MKESLACFIHSISFNAMLHFNVVAHYIQYKHWFSLKKKETKRPLQKTINLHLRGTVCIKASAECATGHFLAQSKQIFHQLQNDKTTC